MMTSIPVFTLSADGNVQLVDTMPPGPPVEVTPAKGQRIHHSLVELFPRVMEIDDQAQLVVCRIIGRDETDPKHEELLLVKSGVSVQTYGRTF